MAGFGFYINGIITAYTLVFFFPPLLAVTSMKFTHFVLTGFFPCVLFNCIYSPWFVYFTVDELVGSFPIFGCYTTLLRWT